MTEPLIGVAAKCPLKNLTLGSAVEEGAPLFEFSDTIGSFLGVKLGHAPVVEKLAAAHGVAEMGAPIVRVVHIGHGRGDTALRHDGVGFPQQGLANHANRGALRERLNCGAQTRAAGADDQNVMFVCFKLGSHRILMSRIIPAETSRM